MGFQHLLGVTERGIGDGGAAQHAREFLRAFGFGKSSDCSARSELAGIFLFGFFDPVMLVRKTGNLGKMGDAEHLLAGAERAQFFADSLSSASADTGINFVED